MLSFPVYDFCITMSPVFCPQPGGGLGGTRRGGADVNIKHSGRDDTSRYDDHPTIGG